MSTMHNFTSELVAMAQSHEQLPHVKGELNAARRDNDKLASTIMSHEERIQALKAEIEALHAKVRDTEAQRDDAELRFLEADDKITRVLGLVKGSVETLAPHLRVVEPEPPKPEPVPVDPVYPEPLNVLKSEPQPLDAQFGYADSREPVASTDPFRGSTEPVPEVAPASPTEQTTSGTGSAGSNGIWGDGLAVHKQPAPYSGKLYKDVPGYISKDDWLAGGGTLENYYSNV